MVVPLLYADPFQRIKTLCSRKSDLLKLSPQEVNARIQEVLKKEPSYIHLVDSDVAATAISVAELGKALFKHDMIAIDSILSNQLQIRELALMCTLLSPLVQDLCVRFPDIHQHFFPPQEEDDFCSCEARETELFDFGPHCKDVRWTSQSYLQHLVSLDLEKFCTRKRRRRRATSRYLTWLPSEFGQLGPTTGKDSAFSRYFSLSWSNARISTLGVADYLQRALLNSPGADRIQCLRIPMHRMRTFQQRHERAPRPRQSRTKPVGQIDILHEPAVVDDPRSLPALRVNKGAVDTNNVINDDKEDRDNSSRSFFANMDELLRPYCFTFNKLTNLRRLEVYSVSNNPCDWETLGRVLSTLVFGSHHGEPEILSAAASNNTTTTTTGTTASNRNGSNSGRKRLPLAQNQIREFHLHTESGLDSRTGKLLNVFDHLEVLELQPVHITDQYWIADWELQRRQRLKALRMGSTTLLGVVMSSYEYLRHFINLEELRVVGNDPSQFTWVEDIKKKEFQRKQRQLQPAVILSGTESKSSAEHSMESGDINTNVTNSHEPPSLCLPLLKKLGVFTMGKKGAETLHIIVEAFSEQLEELVFRASLTPEPARFSHPFPHLTRLALRGEFLDRFDVMSLAKQCPAIELLALQRPYPSYNLQAEAETAAATDIIMDSFVDALRKLGNLRCLFLEGSWRLTDRQILRLARGCPSLYKIGLHDCDILTVDTMGTVNVILSRRTKYPLKTRGLYRLQKSTAEDFTKGATWRKLFFGYEDD
ncbi:hypothetical protein BGZ98_005385 [Dissophora globulifera]|nr:hypothetical protein BGZ98_005385 [Dissophora globulifera]